MPSHTPVVLSDDSRTHKPLDRGSTLPGAVFPVSAGSNNNLTVKSDGLFATEVQGLVSLTHDQSLTGDGGTADPLAVRLSTLDDNAIQLLKQGGSEQGLYVPGDTFLPSVTHDNSLNGNGITTDLSVRISSKSENRLYLEYGAPHVARTEAITCKTFTMPIICEGPDDPTADTACGKWGQGVYWKKKYGLSDAPSGDMNVFANVSLRDTPCKADGTHVPCTVFLGYPSYLNSGETPWVYVWLVCAEVPTHIIRTASGALAEIRRGVAVSTPTGLDDLYGVSNPGSGPYIEIRYMFSK